MLRTSLLVRWRGVAIRSWASLENVPPGDGSLPGRDSLIPQTFPGRGRPKTWGSLLLFGMMQRADSV